MTAERAFYSYDRRRSRRPADGESMLLPSRRAVVPPNPGTDDADFLDNLNEVYGSAIPEDDQVIEGIRRTLRDLLDEQS
jgi:hypothetical protein